MLNRTLFSKSALILFRASLAFIFGYFGVRALINPEYQAALWLDPAIASFVGSVIPLNVFMYLVGGIEVVVAFFVLIGKFLKWVLPLAALVLFGIIVSVGFNEVSLRDAVIFFGVLYLYANYIKVE